MTRREVLRRVVVAFGLAAPPYVVVVHPTLELVHGNPEYFTGYIAGWQLYLAGGGVLAAGVALWFLRRVTGFRVALGIYLVSGVGWFARGLAEHAPVPRWVPVAVLGVILVAGALRVPRRVEDAAHTLGLAGAVLVVGLVSSLWFATTAPAPAPVLEPAGRARPGGADLPNIYHLVFDEFQTEMFEVARTPDVEGKLDGFVYFPAASTPFGRTEMALASMFAPRSFGYDEPLADYIDRAYTHEDSLLGVLRGAGYQTTGWIHSPAFFGGRSPFDRTHLHRDVAPTSGGYDEQAHVLRSTWAYTQLPRVISSRLISARHFEQLEGDVLLPDDAPPVSAMSFRSFLKSERRAPPKGRYVLAHLILPHFPNVLDAGCEYVEGIETDVTAQSRCALRLLEEFVDRLKSLDRYEDSLVIVQSDHGSRYGVRDGNLERVAEDFYSEEWSRARSRPLLLLKPPGSGRGSGLGASSFPATLEDVLPTVADLLGLPHEPSDGRVSLVADAPDRPRRHYHFYDKDPETMTSGDLHRFVITGDAIEFDRSIRVPTR